MADLIDWSWRVHQDPEVIREELQKRGYSDDDIDKAMELAKFIPPIPDLVVMAVREAWRDDVAATYGYDEDFPAEFAEWAGKRGMTEEWAKRYWRAHWNLPGPVTAQDMLWRTAMTDEDYKTLLKIADYPKAFRDWMTETAYRPYTRVDVRRMHAFGTLSDAELVRSYQDVGFDEEKAARMAEFTIAYNRQADDEFTKTEILDGYNSGMLNANEAVGLLISIGKSEDYAWYIIALEEYKRQKSLITEKVKYVKTLYVAGELDRVGATTKLGALDLAAERISRYIEEWDIARAAKIAKPSVSMLEEYYRDVIIDDPTARDELRKRRYPDYVINWIIRDWDQQVVDAARKEAARAQTEQERIAKAKFKTGRSVALADLNVEIADLNLLIAELKLAAFYAVEDEVLKKIKENELLAKREIKRLQLQKAELPVVLA